MKKLMSEEQIEANRANAAKSTGPRTAEGKAVSKMNGFKHGIFAREVVLRGQDRGERGREFHDLGAIRTSVTLVGQDIGNTIWVRGYMF